jgi:hypothetical protein
MGEAHDGGGSGAAGGPFFSRRDLLRGAAVVGAAAGLGLVRPGVAGAAKSAKFPIGASARAKSPVSITMWHSMTWPMPSTPHSTT